MPGFTHNLYLVSDKVIVKKRKQATNRNF